ncbi:MAG: hypothetical protein VYC39_15240 [Myxococcota bacterium]|nr:hypothetical protein [Myxococcota bacterium]
MRRALLSLLFCLYAYPAWSQTSTTATTSSKATAAAPIAPKPPPGFEPIAGKGKRAERVNANVLVTISYGSIFTLLIGYLLFLLRDYRRISEERELLTNKIETQKSSS